MFSTDVWIYMANMIADVAFLKKLLPSFLQMLPFYHICFIPPNKQFFPESSGGRLKTMPFIFKCFLVYFLNARALGYKHSV